MTAIRTILLAEDSLADAEMAVDALREARLANPIVHVEDGVEAMDYLLRRGMFADREEGLPAVLLLDIKMPRLDGLEVLKQVRSDETLKRLPVVILSSSREESDLARSWDLGVNATWSSRWMWISSSTRSRRSARSGRSSTRHRSWTEPCRMRGAIWSS